MDFRQLVRTRQSVRQYLDKPVERAKIESCLEAARLAPSASNSQPWRFIVVDESGLRTEVARATLGPMARFNRFVQLAPALVVLVREPANAEAATGALLKGIPYAWLDLGMAAEHFCLQAAAEDLGTCMIGWFDQGRIKKALGIPRARKVALVIAVGYPATDEVRPKTRKTSEEMRGHNRY